MTAATQTLEERVSALEKELGDIKAQRAETPSPAISGWKKFVGVYKNDPEFEEATRFGREYREAQRPTETEETVA